MKNILRILVPVLVFGLTGCNAIPAAPAAPTTAPTALIAATEIPAPTQVPAVETTALLHTSAGDFEIQSARWVDEIHGNKPAPGEKILLVLLTQPGQGRIVPGAFSLEDFQKAIQSTSSGDQVHLAGSAGAYAISTMAGWVGEKNDEFAMGFRLPDKTETYQLVWPGNEPVAIIPVN